MRQRGTSFTSLHVPADVRWLDKGEHWFAHLAAHLLNQASLVVVGQPHRIVEVEFFYHGGAHRDPFTLLEPRWQTSGRWAYHPTTTDPHAPVALTLTFGNQRGFGGVTLRSLETHTGVLIEGPQRVFAHLLQQTGLPSLGPLAAAAGQWPAQHPGNLLWLRDEPELEPRAIFRAARVDLTPIEDTDWQTYIMRPYRFLSAANTLREGRPLVAMALHQLNLDRTVISHLTGYPHTTLDALVEAFDEGRTITNFAAFNHHPLGRRDRIRLLGTWHRVFVEACTPLAGPRCMVGSARQGWRCRDVRNPIDTCLADMGLASPTLDIECA